MNFLLPFLALVGLAISAPASPSQHDVSYAPNLMQYLLAIRPPDEVLFERGINAAIGKCGKSWLGFCQEQFAKAFQKTVDIFSDPKQFAELIASFYKNPFNNGMLKMCAEQVKFRNCLTSAFYRPCTDALQIYKDQIPDDIGKSFLLAGVYDDIEFDCGGGLTQSVVNWDCIVKVNNNATFPSLIQNCLDIYNTSITKDPRSFCSTGQVLSLCIANAYRTIDECAQKSEAVQWWACERANRRVKLEGYCEQNTCNSLFPVPTKMPQGANGMEFLDFINGGGLFNEAQHTFFKLAGMPRGERKLSNIKQ